MATTAGIPAVSEIAATGTAAGGDGGATEVVTETPTEGAGGEGAAEGTEGTGEGGDGSTEGESEGAGEGDSDPLRELETDGRKVDARTRSAISKLAAADKAAAKIVRDTYFANQAILKEAGATNTRDAINKIRAANATIESLGGEEGITELQDTVSQFNKEAEQFANGDPALINELLEANPEAVVNMAQVTLELLGQRDSMQFEQAILPAFVAKLGEAGFPQTVDTLIALAQKGDGQKVLDILKQMKDWWGGISEANKKRIENKKTFDPEREQIARERAEVQQEKAGIFKGNIETRMNDLNNAATKKIVEPFFRDIKMNDMAARKEFVGRLTNRIFAEIKKDKAFQRQYKVIRSKGDAQKAAEFIHQKFADVLPREFRAYRNQMYPNYKPGTAQSTAQASANGAAPKKASAAAAPAAKAAVSVAQKPAREDVLWWNGKDGTTDDMWIKGQAVLKSGKKVTWDWRRV